MLLQNEYKLQLNTLDIEIDSLYARLIQLKTYKDYSSLEIKLRDHLKEFGKTILQKKKKKNWRDKNDFSKNRAYKWSQNNKKCNNNKKLNIINLSSHLLTPAECHLLSSGLSFCPLDIFETVKDINFFARKLQFKIMYNK